MGDFSESKSSLFTKIASKIYTSATNSILCKFVGTHNKDITNSDNKKCSTVEVVRKRSQSTNKQTQTSCNWVMYANCVHEPLANKSYSNRYLNSYMLLPSRRKCKRVTNKRLPYARRIRHLHCQCCLSSPKSSPLSLKNCEKRNIRKN